MICLLSYLNRTFVLFLMLGLALPVSAQVLIEVVNDSGKPDSTVFIKTPGRLCSGITNTPVTPTNLFVDIGNTNVTAAEAISVPLSMLATTNWLPPQPLVSTITGRTNMVYTLRADAIQSGGLYVTYDKAFTFTSGLQPSPPPDSAGNAYRYDYAEFTINDSNAVYNAVDLTYVDKFGIPMQLEWFRGSNLLAGSYVYTSTRTLVDQFADAGLGQAVFSLNSNNITPGWTYSGPDSYTNFARILAPQKVSGLTTSVSPYPSMTNYLNALAGPTNAFWMNGSSPQGGYYYMSYHVSLTTNTDSWTITMTHTTNHPPFNPALITGTKYTNTISFVISNYNVGQYIYGAPVGPNLYSTNNTLVTNTAHGSYPLEVWMIGDVLSALNFGFWGGIYGTNSADWFSPVQWTAFPFGSARRTYDGYYNFYAALMYNNADPYGFAFSERITPDVLLAPGNGDRIRITILPDDRMNSPVVPVPTTNMITSDSITLNWGRVAGATGYKVDVLRPFNIPPVILSSNATSCTLSNLMSGTPYVMSVQAMGTGAFENAIITPARQVSATTLGTCATNSGTFAQVQATFSVADPYYQLGKVHINGVELIYSNSQWETTGGVPARWIAPDGTNQVVVTVFSTNNRVLFNDWLTFVLAHTNGTATNSAISAVSLHGQKLSQPPPGVSGFLFGTTATNFWVSKLNPCLSIGLSYVPAETRRYSFVGSPAPVVIITNAMPLMDGEFELSFNVPAGVHYNVEASTNLTGWKTISSGLGEAGGESYSDSSAPTNNTRFYRIKL